MLERGRAVVWSCSRRARSRVGAVAHGLATGPSRRVLAFTTRVALLLAGASVIGTAVAVMLWDDLGPGPLDVFIGAIRRHTGLPLALAMWTTVGTLIAVAWRLGRRPGAGTLLAPFAVGAVAQVVTGVLGGVAVPESSLTRVVIHLAAIGAAGIGAGALIASGLGAGSGELLAAAASERTGRREPQVRMALEVGWVAIGLALGGPAGLGTVLVALFIGPAVAAGLRLVDRTLASARRQVALSLVALAP